MGNECFIATPEEIDVLMDIDDSSPGSTAATPQVAASVPSPVIFANCLLFISLSR